MMKKPEIDPYEPCLCGSGMKYKFCCYLRTDRKFHNEKESYVETEKNKDKLSFCLYENDDCSGDIIKSHSIQNNKILSKLAVNGHVYVADYNSNNFLGADLRKCGRNEATTSTCFCHQHDTKLFLCIEKQNYKYKDEQNFLYAYRAFSKGYYDKLEERNTHKYLFQQCHKRCMESGFIERMRGTISGVQDNEEIRAYFNDALERKDFSVVETLSVTLDYEIMFATSYIIPLSYDLNGNMINDVYDIDSKMKNIYVSIFPESGKSYVLISWLTSEREHFQGFKTQFIELQKDNKKFFNMLNNMVICQSDNFAISPVLVDSWDEKTKQLFLNEFVSILIGDRKRNGINIGLVIEKNMVSFPCRFNLFV